MSPELQEVLFVRHSRILGRMRESGTDIECGDGWFDLLDTLCGRLQFHTDLDGAPRVVALQIREKFGTLRFYAEGADEMHGGMIDVAQAMSERICRGCGGRLPCLACSRTLAALRTAGTR